MKHVFVSPWKRGHSDTGVRYTYRLNGANQVTYRTVPTRTQKWFDAEIAASRARRDLRARKTAWREARVTGLLR